MILFRMIPCYFAGDGDRSFFVAWIRVVYRKGVVLLVRIVLTRYRQILRRWCDAVGTRHTSNSCTCRAYIECEQGLGCHKPVVIPKGFEGV